MTGNPELRRNLWLELTPHRLVGMPLVLAGLFLLAYLFDERVFGAKVASLAVFLFVLLAILWGTRQASEAVVSELRDHTWDGQRLSVIGPWSMTWGKLLGATAYPWYGALICLAVLTLASPDPAVELLRQLLILPAAGLLAQATGLLASLQAIRKDRRFRRSQGAAFLVLGIGVGLPLLSLAFGSPRPVAWYGWTLPLPDFVLLSTLAFLAWALIGCYRLLRAELQLKNLPLIWVGFVLFVMVYAAGLAPAASDPAPRLLAAFVPALLLTYAMAFSERKDPVALRRLLLAGRDRRWRGVLLATPLWLATLPLVLLGALPLAAVGPPEAAFGWPGPHGGAAVLGLCLFLLRDLGLILFLNLGRSPKRADLLAVLDLALLYGIVPAILSALGQRLATGLFWPRADLPPALVLVAAGAEALLVALLVRRRWRHLHARPAVE